MKTEAEIKEAIGKAKLHKVNSYNNADFEGFLDEEILLNELGMM